MKKNYIIPEVTTVDLSVESTVLVALSGDVAVQDWGHDDAYDI